MTNTKKTNATISARILALLNSGKTLPEALDTVLGAGSYGTIAGDVYEALKAGR